MTVRDVGIREFLLFTTEVKYNNERLTVGEKVTRTFFLNHNFWIIHQIKNDKKLKMTL